MKGKAQMSTSPHVNDVFDAFVAAKQAIDKVPDLEAQIAKLTADLQTANQMVEQYDIELAHHKEELSKAQDAKSTVEASLETHRKSNSDLQARFDLVLGTLRDITSGIGTTLGVVEPPKEPEPTEVPLAPDTSANISTTVASQADGTVSSGVSVSTDPTSGYSNPAPEVPVTPAVPFAPSMESQSPNAPSADATASSTTPVAPPSGDASSPPQMPDWLYRNLR